MGRLPDHDHTLWLDHSWFPGTMYQIREVLRHFPFSDIPVTPVECNNQVTNTKGHEKHPIDCPETHILSMPGIASEKKLSGESMTPGQKEPSKTCQLTFEQWCSFCHEKGLLVLEVCVNTLVEYLDFLQVTHDYVYTTLCM